MIHSQSFKVNVPLTNEQKRDFYTSRVCHMCNKPFTTTDAKHRDHHHFTEKYPGAAHQGCNVNYKKAHHIPIVFHNLSGYDSHFSIKALATLFDGSVNLLPINKERYISFTKQVQGTSINLQFIDSLRFMASSLEKLTSYRNDIDKCITRKECSNSEEFKLLTRKGVFPYEYVNSWNRLEERQLPPKDKFHSKLTNEELSEEDCIHAVRV